MRYLLDTHIWIWAAMDSGRLSTQQRKILEDAESTKYISLVSVWEISLKFSLKKLHLGGLKPEEFLEASTQEGLEILTPSATQLATFHNMAISANHKDPFDRLLIWQAMQENMPLLSGDKQLRKYEDSGLKIIE